jgi:hypothetical protein
MTTVRVAAHVHSDWSSDGTFPLPRIAAEFSRRGYDAVLLAEHDRSFDAARCTEYRDACARASLPGTALIPGIEYSDPGNRVHVPVWGVERFLGRGRPTAELLGAVRDHDGIAVLAHPGRRDALSTLDPECLRRFDGLELWNRKYDGIAPNRAAAAVLAAHPALLPFVSLEFHTARQFHPLVMALELDGPVSETALVGALRHRRARPLAFGRDAHTLVGGAAGSAVRSLERGRRGVAPLARAVRARREAAGRA